MVGGSYVYFLHDFIDERRDNWCLFVILIIPIIALGLLVIPLVLIFIVCCIPIMLIIFAFHETLTQISYPFSYFTSIFGLNPNYMMYQNEKHNP